MTKRKTITLGLLAAALWLGADSSAATLEEEKESYEQQAEEKLQQSQELQSRINTVSEEKRVIDAELDEAMAFYQEMQGELDAINARIEENEAILAEKQADYEQKNYALGARVRDIYINGQISYLDVLFGADDFQDLMTRMDLLKRVIKRDYNLVQAVLAEKAEIEKAQTALEEDRAAQEPLVEKARTAKDVMLRKQRKRQELLDKMENDKAVYDQQYNELMAASKQIEQMILASAYQASMPAGSGGAMIWPLGGPITSEFGWRTHPIFGSARFHSGIDIGGDYGLPIHAAQAGVVTHAGWISGYGNTVIIDHGGGISSLYGHNQSLAVGEGQSVSQGEVIAYCGSTGNSTGPHCHFEVRENGSPVSPYGYL